MGGTGSGSWYRWDAKDTTESQHRVDIRWMRKQGYLQAGKFVCFSWSRGSGLDLAFDWANAKSRHRALTWTNHKISCMPFASRWAS